MDLSANGEFDVRERFADGAVHRRNLRVAPQAARTR